MEDYKKALHKGELFVAILLSCLAAVSTVVETICLGKIIDILARNGRDITNFLCVIMGSIVVQYVCNTINIRILGRTLLHTRYALNRLIYQKTLEIDYRELEKLKSGELNTLFLTDVETIINYLRYLVDCMSGICAAALSLVICIGISWKFFLICIPVFPIMVIGSLIFNFKFQEILEKRKKAEEEAGTEFLGAIKNSDCIKAYGIESFMQGHYEKIQRRVKKIKDKEAAIRGKMAAKNRMVGAIPYISLFIAGIYMIWRKEISAGMFISFSYIFSNIQSLQDILGIISEFKSYKVSKERILHFQDILSQKEGKYISAADDDRDNGLYLENVSFYYAEGTQVFKNISLCCYQGTITAIMGESGSGKSTLLKLISGLYPLQEGKILLAGAGELVSNEYGENNKKLVGVVFQENFLFNGTIRENITMGNDTIEEQRIVEACKMADIWEEIQKLPKGLDTEVAEGGSSFSGGQRQRICLARVLYAKPYVLILDEPSANLDPISEERVIRNISIFCRDMITILVSHRDSTVKYADRVYYLERGQIHENGSRKYADC